MIMPSLPDDLATLKDDMIAFIEGHGIRRFPGFVDREEVQTVVWKPGDNAAEGWRRARHLSSWIRGNSSARNWKT
jgi:hypothetical protein